jgi:hypothetical protein
VEFLFILRIVSVRSHAKHSRVHHRELNMRWDSYSGKRGTLGFKLLSVGRIREPRRCVSTSARKERTEGTSRELTR